MGGFKGSTTKGQFRKCGLTVVLQIMMQKNSQGCATRLWNPKKTLFQIDPLPWTLNFPSAIEGRLHCIGMSRQALGSGSRATTASRTSAMSSRSSATSLRSSCTSWVAKGGPLTLQGALSGQCAARRRLHAYVCREREMERQTEIPTLLLYLLQPRARQPGLEGLGGLGRGPSLVVRTLLLLLVEDEASDEARHGPEDRDASQHQDHGDDTPTGRDGGHVSVAHRGHGRGGPPEGVSGAVDGGAGAVQLEGQDQDRPSDPDAEREEAHEEAYGE